MNAQWLYAKMSASKRWTVTVALTLRALAL